MNRHHRHHYHVGVGQDLVGPAAAVRVIARGKWSLATLSAWCEDPAHTGLAKGPPEVSNQRRESQMADGRESNLLGCQIHA
jgi:hypothetical protein